MVVGLGNPGREYEQSRHNIGFLVLDRLAARRRVRFKRAWRARALVGRAKLGQEELLLVKPQTYMNRSGQALKPLMRKHGLLPQDVVVVVDDADLEMGRLRIRKKGGAGHHNGLKSIIDDLASNEFVRLRVGIGAKPDGGDMVDHVLGPIGNEEWPAVEKAIDSAVDALEVLVLDGADQAMNRFNAGL